MKTSYLIFSIFILCFNLSYAQKKSQTNAQNSIISLVDQDMTIKHVVVVPISDNAKNIYAQYLNPFLRELVETDKQWQLYDLPNNIQATAVDIENSAELAQSIMQKTQTDAILTAHLVKGLKGIRAQLSLYVGESGQLLINEEIVDFQGFDIRDVKSQFAMMYENLRKKLPYRGLVLSRKNLEVTINLGAKHGLKVNDSVNVIQILRINRHPKFHFMISSEKEILGKIVLTKVDEYLSFGSITYERDNGVVQVGAKVQPIDFVKYPAPVVGENGKVVENLGQRKDAPVAFGDNPSEWLPSNSPQFGKVQFLGGIGQYYQNLNLTTEGGVFTQTIAPHLKVRGELWLDPQWTLAAQIHQAVFTLPNPVSSSTPALLNSSLSSYQFAADYGFLLSNDFFGPKLKLGAGFTSTSFSADDSTPIALTDMKYSSLMIRFDGSFPMQNDARILLGAHLDYYYNPTLSENYTSGSSNTSNTVSSFYFYGSFQQNQNFRWIGEIDFDQMSSKFNGTGERTDPATSIGHKLMTLMAGFEYLF